jgi:hypothetical protein
MKGDSWMVEHSLRARIRDQQRRRREHKKQADKPNDQREDFDEECVAPPKQCICQDDGP